MGKRKKKKKRNLGPRRKRMRRPARLATAVKWCAGYGGNSIQIIAPPAWSMAAAGRPPARHPRTADRGDHVRAGAP
jgi:hypothetical protein